MKSENNDDKIISISQRRRDILTTITIKTNTQTNNSNIINIFLRYMDCGIFCHHRWTTND